MSCNTVRNEEIKVFKTFHSDGIISCIDLTSFSEAFFAMLLEATILLKRLDPQVIQINWK
jgi:hypothetical protein